MIENPCVGASIPLRATKNIVHATLTHAIGVVVYGLDRPSCPVNFWSRAQDQLAGTPSDTKISKLLKLGNSYIHIALCSRQAASAASARMGLK